VRLVHESLCVQQLGARRRRIAARTHAPTHARTHARAHARTHTHLLSGRLDRQAAGTELGRRLGEALMRNHTIRTCTDQQDQSPLF
jgi:hypothetical protein